MKVTFRRLRFWAFCLTVFVVAAEATARLDDWLRYGTSIWAYPDNGTDLRVVDSAGVRGRPFGHYQQFVLNNFGFRSNRDHTLHPRASCMRIMTLGASETFGLLEPAGKEYPAQLESILDSEETCAEVLNAAVAGMSLPAIHYTWLHYWRTFRPKFVVVYPSPAFYLSEDPPRPPSATSLREPQSKWPSFSFRPRLVHRAKEAIELPGLIQRSRVQRRINAAIQEIGNDSIWRSIPQERLEQFGGDLESLVSDISKAGATPILLTHARRFPVPPEPVDSVLLLAWRSFSPRAEPNVLVEFDTAAAELTRRLASKDRVRLVDVDRCLSGRRPLFGDPVHFTEAGAERVARLVAQEIRRGVSGQPLIHDLGCPIP
jgi:hypothetical protein